MAQEFDPYHAWLGIPPHERPADHYRLLGVPQFEENADVISNAADARMAFIRTFQAGPKGVHSQQILNELAAARTTLLNKQRRSAYDQQLKAATASQAVPAPDQQAILDDLARQLESVKARESLLAKQQADYAAALAQAESLRQAQIQKPSAAAAPHQAAVAALPAIVTTPVIAARKPVRKKSVPLLLIIAGVALPVVLIGLVVAYVATRGKTDPVVQKPKPAPDIPVKPKTSKPDPKPVTDPPGKSKPLIEKPPVVPVASKEEAAPPSTPDARSPVDLLAKIQLPRDLVRGTAAQEQGGISLRSPEGGGFSCVKIPQPAPPNYQLDLRVIPRDATDGLIIGVSVGGRPCIIGIDGYRMTGPPRSALEAIEGRRPYEPGFDGPIHVGQLLKDGVESRLSVRVMGGSVQLTCDGQEVFVWRGDPGKLSILPLFGEFPDRSMFVASWSASYDVAGLSLQPLEGPTIVASSQKPTPPAVTPATDSRPWRWARFHNGAAGLVLTSSGKRAIIFQPGRAPWSIEPIDLSTGERAKVLEGQGSIEDAQTLAVGPDSLPLVAFSVMETSGMTTLVRSLSGERKREREYAKQPSDMRYAFSADGKYLAASVGPLVNLISVDSGRSIAHIDPPPDMRVSFVERLLDDDGLLLVLYSVKKNGGGTDNRAVAYDWKTRRPKKTRDFTIRGTNLRGVCFQNDVLWVWGNDIQRGAVTSYPVAGQGESRLRLFPGQTVTDIHIPTQTALVVDANAPRLTVRSFAANGKQTQVEYARPLADARFVEDGKAILCQPGTAEDLTLLWETAPLLDARRVVAPTIKEVGLDDVQRQTADKAIQRSDIK